MREDYQHELIPGPDIDFNEIRDLFDPMLWDVGYLNDTGFQRASAAPVKTKFHLYGSAYTFLMMWVYERL